MYIHICIYAYPIVYLHAYSLRDTLKRYIYIYMCTPTHYIYIYIYAHAYVAELGVRVGDIELMYVSIHCFGFLVHVWARAV